jgi:hypothetical protein
MRIRQKAILGVALGCLVAVSATPVLAYQGEGGTKTCPSNQTGKAQAKYYDMGAIIAPGSSSTGTYTFNDNQWHISQRWGEDGGGEWHATGDPYLNLTDTYAFCTTR